MDDDIRPGPHALRPRCPDCRLRPGFKAKWFGRGDSNIEPVNLWGMPGWSYNDIIHRVMATAVIDLTATHVSAMPCMEVGIPYMDLCFTNLHVMSMHSTIEIGWHPLPSRSSPSRAARCTRQSWRRRSAF
jgi:hypothetical protein